MVLKGIRFALIIFLMICQIPTVRFTRETVRGIKVWRAKRKDAFYQSVSFLKAISLFSPFEWYGDQWWKIDRLMGYGPIWGDWKDETVYETYGHLPRPMAILWIILKGWS